MSDTTERMTEYLEENPRMIGAMFTLLVLLSQAGSALAGSGTTTVGP